MATISKLARFKKGRRLAAFIALIILVVLTPLAIYISRNADQISAAWWDDSYTHRQSVSYTHNADIAAERAITFSLDTAELITAGVMESDCDDTRYTDINGKKLVFELTGTCNNAATTYEVVVPEVFDDNNVFFVYYGNASALDAGVDASGYTALTPSGGDPAITDRASEETTPGPIAYWKFDEGVDDTCSGGSNDACDSTSRGNDLTLTNASWQTEDLCVNEKCIHFDGDGDLLSRADDDEFDFVAADDFSISAWIKHPGIATSEDIVLAKHETSGGDGGYKVLMESDGDITCAIDDDNTWDPDDTASSTTANYDDNLWHHVVCVKNDTTDLTLYVDGVQVAQDASIAATGTLANNDTLYIGIDGDGAANDWDGFIDEVKIYRYARSAAEVRSDFLRGAASQGSSAVLGATDNSFLNEGLVGYWKMNEASWNGTADEVIDSSGNGIHGTRVGDATTTTGKFGRGGTFDGTGDYASNSNDGGILAADNITVAAWVKSNSDTGTVAYRGHTNGDCHNYGLNLSAGALGLTYTGCGPYSVNVYSSTDTYTWTDGWHHVAVTISFTDGDSIKIYRDGILIPGSWTTGTGSASPSVIYNRLNIGRRGTLALAEFTGIIDDVRIYNRTLSPSEISTLYNWAPGPVAHWKLDEVGGGTRYDSSGNSYNLSDNDTVDTVVGKYGGAGQFTASETEWLDISSNTDLQGGDRNFSVTGWVYLDSKPSDGIFISKWGNSAVNYEYYLSYNSSSDRFRFVTRESDDSGSIIVNADKLGSPALNTWYFVAVWHDSINDTTNIEINGSGVDSTAQTGGLPSTSQAFRIGRHGDSGGYFDGKIDDVRIYRYLLSPGQRISAMNAGHPAPGSPVGSATSEWKFDSGHGTTAYDASINSNDLTLSAASWISAGKYDKAWNGDGTVYLSRSDDADFDFAASQDFTVSGWFKHAVASVTEVIMYKFESSGADGGYMVQMESDGDITFGVDDDNTAFTDTATSTLATYDDNSWHHFVGSKDDSSIKLYIDAELITTTTLTETGTLENDDTLYVGDSEGTDDGDEFIGDLDQLAIYRSALTADQIKILYNAKASTNFGAGTTEANDISDGAGNPPVAYWTINEGVDNTCSGGSNDVCDISGTGVDGAISADASWVNVTNIPANSYGLGGKALTFDGDGDVVRATEVAAVDLGETTDSVTLEGWFKIPNGADFTNIRNTILAKDDGSARWPFTIFIRGNEQPAFEVSDGTFTPPPSFMIFLI